MHEGCVEALGYRHGVSGDGGEVGLDRAEAVDGQVVVSALSCGFVIGGVGAFYEPKSEWTKTGIAGWRPNQTVLPEQRYYGTNELFGALSPALQNDPSRAKEEITSTSVN
jgi:hypothetical protein